MARAEAQASREEHEREREECATELERVKVDAHDRLAALEIRLKEKTAQYDDLCHTLDEQEDAAAQLEHRVDQLREELEETEAREKVLKSEVQACT